MALRAAVVAAAVSALINVGLTASGPATADATYPWEMPDVEGMTLAAATAAVRQASGDPEQEVASMEAHDRLRRQLVPSLWTVCWQAPEAGTVVEGPTWVGAGVTRLGTACWD